MEKSTGGTHNMIYFDNAATTIMHKEVVEAMRPYWSELYGNPSSLYDFAIKSRESVEKSRKRIADVINAKPEEIYFTSGGYNEYHKQGYRRRKSLRLGKDFGKLR